MPDGGVRDDDHAQPQSRAYVDHAWANYAQDYWLTLF
jgi:hypothetical protein